MVVGVLDLLDGQFTGNVAEIMAAHAVGDHKERAPVLQELLVRYYCDKLIFIVCPFAPNICALPNIQPEWQRHSYLFLSGQREIAPAMLYPTVYPLGTDR